MRALAPVGGASSGLEASPTDLHRLDRWNVRAVLWRESSLRRVRTCGRWAVTADGSVGVRANGAAVGYAGLASCGSVWACPVCNSKIQGVRRLEVGVALSAVLGSGGGAAFGAYTLRHHAGSNLDDLWRSLSKCWQAVARDKTVRQLRTSLRLVGTIRAAEVTHGFNGWHPHLHPVHLFERPVSDDAVNALHAAQFRAWSAAAARLELEAPTFSAQNLHRIEGAQADEELAAYFTKTVYRPSSEAVGWEMTSTQTKARTRSGGLTPWEVLREVYVNGDADALDLWHTWEAASRGKRALTWSRGLRARVGLDVEATDEDIATEVVGTVEDTGFEVTDWGPVRARPWLGAALLSAIGPGADWAAGRALCEREGIPIRDAALGARERLDALLVRSSG